MTTLLIENARILQGGAFRAGALLVDGASIAGLAFSDDDREAIRGRAARTTDAGGMLLIPGLVDAHAHAYASLLRGTENSLPLELWALFTVAYGNGLDAEAIRAAILLGAAERLRAGITGYIDHATQKSPEVALATHELTGLRVGYATFLHDIGDIELFEQPIPEALRAIAGSPPKLDAEAYAARFAAIVAQARAGSGRVQALLGPNAPQRCTPEAWALWRRLRDLHDVGVHTHLLETRAQAELGRRRWPGGTVAEMERQGLLDHRLSVAHGIWTSPEEAALLARHGVSVSHNPASNLMLGSGVLRFAECRARGIPMALGTDSANSGGRHDLWEVMRLAMMIHRADGGDPASWPSAAEMFEMATVGGARVLGLAGELGVIAPGMAADLVLMRDDGAAGLTLTGNLAGLVQHGSPDAVDSVMVDGRWLMRRRRILAFDEAAALDAARTAQARILERLGDAPDQVARAMPAVQEALVAWMER